MTEEKVCLHIEHHAVLFALLAKQAVELCGERGKESILRGMTVYGMERGTRMAWNEDGVERPEKRRPDQHDDKSGLR